MLRPGLISTFNDLEICTVESAAIYLCLQTDTVNVSWRHGVRGHCLRQRGCKSASAILDLFTFVCPCQQMRHGWSGPFHGHELQPLSVVTAVEREKGAGLLSVQHRILSFPLPPLESHWIAPSGGRVSNRSKDHWGNTWSLLQWCILQIPDLFLKTCMVINDQKRRFIWFKPVLEPKQQRYIPAVMSGERWPPLPLPGKQRPSLTAPGRQNAGMANGSQVIFPLCIMPSSTGNPDSLTHQTPQTAEVSARSAWGRKPTLVLWKANLLAPVHWIS